MASGAGGLYPRELCGLMVLYSLLQFSISTLASRSVVKIFPLRSSSLSFPFVMFHEVPLENFESDSGETRKITNIHRSFQMMKEADAIMALPLLFYGLIKECSIYKIGMNLSMW